ENKDEQRLQRKIKELVKQLDEAKQQQKKLQTISSYQILNEKSNSILPNHSLVNQSNFVETLTDNSNMTTNLSINNVNSNESYIISQSDNKINLPTTPQKVHNSIFLSHTPPLWSIPNQLILNSNSGANDINLSQTSDQTNYMLLNDSVPFSFQSN